MGEARWVDDEEACRIRDDILDGALPIVWAGSLFVNTDGKRRLLPFVQVDTTGRNDVADLFRVVQIEGMQARSDTPCRYVFCERHGYRETTITITDPVACSFKFVLTWPEQREIFDAMLQHEVLMITARNVQEQMDWSDVFGIRIFLPEFQLALQSWEELYQASTEDDTE
jgi:hypothetical protein